MIETLIARFYIHGAIAVAVLVAFFAWDSSRVNKGRQLERAAIEKRGDTNAQRAEAARRSADRLPADRLRDRFCRDC